MSKAVLRAERIWSAVPSVTKLAMLAAVLIALLLAGVSPALANSNDPNPFRWK